MKIGCQRLINKLHTFKLLNNIQHTNLNLPLRYIFISQIFKLHKSTYPLTTCCGILYCIVINIDWEHSPGTENLQWLQVPYTKFLSMVP
ncbi:unnamed protein product [Callosobruchus maculatus]|uniref:Uncharacterized protein n=1 Tax=Callosobruchus maculatus TaxID=64391 RepID=A0A653BVP3_CALMS|nr:unnamed protein product [Callosobruchus maculatus]